MAKKAKAKKAKAKKAKASRKPVKRAGKRTSSRKTAARKSVAKAKKAKARKVRPKKAVARKRRTMAGVAAGGHPDKRLPINGDEYHELLCKWDAAANQYDCRQVPIGGNW